VGALDSLLSRQKPLYSIAKREWQAQARGKLLFFQLFVNRLPDYVGNNNSPDYKQIDHSDLLKKTVQCSRFDVNVEKSENREIGYRISLKHKKST
jgi:hypothetical protein